MEYYLEFNIHVSSAYPCDQYQFAGNMSFHLHSTLILLSIIQVNIFACFRRWLFHATLYGIVIVCIRMKLSLYMILKISYFWLMMADVY